MKKNQKNNATTTPETLEALKAERAKAEADRKAALARKRYYDKMIAEEEAPVEEAEAIAEVADEAPVEEVEAVAEVADEAPVEEVEAVAEVADEAPAEEVEAVAEVADEAPAEEVEAVAEVADEAPVEEVEAVAEVADEAPAEEVEAVAEVADEAPAEEVEAVAEVADETPTEEKGSFWSKFFTYVWRVAGVVALVALIVTMVAVFGSKPPQIDEGGENGGVGESGGNNTVAFDMDAFKASVEAIAAEYTEVDVSGRIDILANNIGEDKLVELIEDLGERPLKEGMAQYVAFAETIKTAQFISLNGLDYNPDYNLDYSNKKAELDAAYKVAVGQDLNPDGVLISLPGYDSCVGNRAAIRALIEESGDSALLTWYNAKMEIYDLKLQQKEDYESIIENQEKVLNNLLKSDGAVELLELQIKKVASEELVVVDNTTNSYTEAYYQFIINNYTYVVG